MDIKLNIGVDDLELDVRCDGCCGDKIIYTTVKRKDVATKCPKCKGKGRILQYDGRQLLEFIQRWTHIEDPTNRSFDNDVPNRLKLQIEP